MNNFNSAQLTDAGPLIDGQALENLRALRSANEPDPLAELTQLYLEDTPGRIAQLQSALRKNSALDLEAAAHSLKGSSGNLGARTIAAACGGIMQHARKNDFSPVSKLIDTIEADFQKVKPALLEELKR